MGLYIIASLEVASDSWDKAGKWQGWRHRLLLVGNGMFVSITDVVIIAVSIIIVIIVGSSLNWSVGWDCNYCVLLGVSEGNDQYWWQHWGGCY